MNEREQPDPGDGWRLASGDDCKDVRCEIWMPLECKWRSRSASMAGEYMTPSRFYRIPTDKPQPDLVNSPPHYRQGDIECIDAIRAALTPEEFRGYLKGNAIKYVWRERHKGGDQDLRKAEWYLSRIETKVTE